VTEVPAIEFAGVSRWYGDTVAVADVSFTVGPGVTGLLGHNGAGKSTTLKLCAGFTSPSGGTVRIFGVEPRRNPGVYERVGVVPDQSPPWPFLTTRPSDQPFVAWQRRQKSPTPGTSLFATSSAAQNSGSRVAFAIIEPDQLGCGLYVDENGDAEAA